MGSASSVEQGERAGTGSLADGPIDTTVRLVTPERVVFEYPLAGPFRRLLAYLLDLAIWGSLWLGCYVVALVVTGGEEGTADGVFRVAAFVLLWGYGGLFEAVWNGQTPGKSLLRLRVVSVSGAPITGGQALLRNLFWPVEGIFPLGGMPALASVVLTRRFQRLGDLAAGTMVVAEARPLPAVLPKVREPESLALLPRLPRQLELGSEASRALADYVKRRKRFNPARREEMAAHLADPLRRKYDLPASSSGDAVLGAVYQRVFVEESPA